MHVMFSQMDYSTKEGLIRKHYFPGVSSRTLAELITNDLCEDVSRNAVLGIYLRASRRAERTGVQSTLHYHPLPVGKSFRGRKERAVDVSKIIKTIAPPKPKPTPVKTPEPTPPPHVLVVLDSFDRPLIQPRDDVIISHTNTVLMSITEYDQNAKMLTLDQLKRKSCRWPIKNITEQLFCGHDQREGKSYCDHHYLRATATPLEFKIANRRAKKALTTYGHR